ncbi:hypothetical protein DFH07DRAFT_950398 [Mycena maculata]|uniref:BTB domain-containing protein n=1 Tax=Mycena maculata TaxID=230809 RepID=A0AAD7NXJ0_9AGAR|nr:hypothetical protein DFH07DRAFT_950398 [Mycena maculata]
MATAGAESMSDRRIKRARADSMPSRFPTPAVRDERFYQESGDCVVRVEDTLFKIHRFLLVRDSPVFARLFTPQSGIAEEGLSDDLPIFLGGDKAAQFRALFKYIYAPALETQAKTIPIEELQNVVAVGNLAQKYEMQSWQAWAGLVIEDFLDQSAGLLSSPDFFAIYELSYKASADEMRRRTVGIWRDRIEAFVLPIPDALDAAELHNDRNFLTSLYEIQLARMPTTTATGLQPPSMNLSRIAPIHLQRIFAGYWALSVAWNQFRRDPLPLTRAAHCSQERHDRACQPAFKRQWEVAASETETTCPLTSLCARVCRMKEHLAYARLFEADDQELCQFTRLSAYMLEELAKMANAVPRTLEGYFFS